jgi:acetyl esterase
MTQTDYQSVIDAATWAFIARTAESYPDGTATATIAEQRRIYDAMCATFHHGSPVGATVQDHTIGGVPCRDYSGAWPTIVYLHGGGFVVGGLQSHDDVCAEICAATGLRVVSVDYRLSPENLHPAALDDALAVTRALLAAGPVVLAGDSAGGNLAAATAHALRADPSLRGLVLIYPGLGGDSNTGSYLTHAAAPMLSRDDVLYYMGVRQNAPGDPTASPLLDPDLTGLPPTVAFSAECDPLADDTLHYCARLTAAGVRVHRTLETGLVHGYLRARHSVPRASASFARITTALTALAAGDWPYGDAP